MFTCMQYTYSEKLTPLNFCGHPTQATTPHHQPSTPQPSPSQALPIYAVSMTQIVFNYKL